MTSTTRDRTGTWKWCRRGLLAFIPLILLVAIETGAAWLLVPGLVIFVIAGRFLDPSRPYWGPGPERIMGDPDERRRYQRGEWPFVVAMVVLMALAVLVIRWIQAA